MKIKSRKQMQGVTLTELMCVLAIIGILMAFYLPTLARAYKHIRTFLLGN
jgi:prepilin-type N-terminal cleavage/methylation domain-containing protein